MQPRKAVGMDSFEGRAVQASITQYYYAVGDYERALRESQDIIDNSDMVAEKVVLASVIHLRARVLANDSHAKNASPE